MELARATGQRGARPECGTARKENLEVSRQGQARLQV